MRDCLFKTMVNGHSSSGTVILYYQRGEPRGGQLIINKENKNNGTSNCRPAAKVLLPRSSTSAKEKWLQSGAFLGGIAMCLAVAPLVAAKQSLRLTTQIAAGGMTSGARKFDCLLVVRWVGWGRKSRSSSIMKGENKDRPERSWQV